MVKLIEIKNLEFRYPGTDSASLVLKNINLNIKKGEFVSLIGPNGCGKSTLARHLNGLFLPTAGSVTVNGMLTTNQEQLAFIRKQIGMVFQNPDNQLFASIVEEDVAFGCENLCLPRDEIKTRVNNALAQVGMLEHSKHPPHRLSGGQKQKVAIAGVLAMEPECIVLDEPTSMLDPKGRHEVLDAVRKLNSVNGITVIYVTHDMAETLYTNRLIAMSGGEVVFDGSPAEFFSNPEFPGRAGVTVPAITDLVHRLAGNGLKFNQEIKSPKDLVEAICQLSLKM